LKHLGGIVVFWLVGVSLYGYLVIKNMIVSGDVAGTLSGALFGTLWQGSVLNTSISLRIVAENIVFIVLNYPTRRRIITWLIIIGNAGLVAIIVTATSSVTTSQGYHIPISIVGLFVGAYLLYLLMRHTGLLRSWEGFIQKRLIKSQVFEESITEDLLHFLEGYGVVRVTVNQNSPLAGHSIRESFSPETQLWIVGIERDKDWISLPRPRELMEEGDRLVVYGNLNVFKSVFK